jgi:hypothetical protein
MMTGRARPDACLLPNSAGSSIPAAGAIGACARPCSERSSRYWGRGTEGCRRRLLVQKARGDRPIQGGRQLRIHAAAQQRRRLNIDDFPLHGALFRRLSTDLDEMRDLTIVRRFRGPSCNGPVCRLNTDDADHPPKFLMSTLILILSQPGRQNGIRLRDKRSRSEPLIRAGGVDRRLPHPATNSAHFICVDIIILWRYTANHSGPALPRPMRSQ